MSRKAIGRRSVVAAALAAPLLSSAGWAQGAWPTKPIRIVVPFNPGGAIDALVRVIADGLTAKLGQQVLVDPKPGANTIVGSEIVAKAAARRLHLPDHHQLHPHQQPDALRQAAVRSGQGPDAGVAGVARHHPASLVKADAPYSDLRGMAKWVKELGRPATYGSWGIGSSGHLYGLMFEQVLGGHYSHVPYKGDVLGPHRRAQRHARRHLHQPDQRQAADRPGASRPSP